MNLHRFGREHNTLPCTLGVTALLLLSLPFTAALPPPQAPLRHNDRPQNGTRGAVACESALCSRIGTDMIELGGSAADALVAATLCVGVVAMYHSGIGGGGFLLVRDPERGVYETVDFRETAPAAAHRDMYAGLSDTASTVGGLAVAVPGEVRGLETVHERWGKLSWRTVVMPAVRVAREGFRVNEDLVRYMNRVGGNASFLVSDPAWAEDFAPNGTLVKLGDLMTRKRYANTLETIAIHGPDAFYYGKIAESIVNATQSSNGILTLADMAEYAIQTRTSHLVTTDSTGLTLSSTTTINLLFGALLLTPDTGIPLNNEMDDFSQPGRRNAFGYDPAPHNYIAPGKRPLSSISPVIAEREGGEVVLATGAAGGSRIVSATAETVWRVLGRGMGLEEAVRGSRVHDQLIPAETLVEEGVEESVVRGLMERGHNVTVVGVGLSAVHGVVRGEDGVFEAVGETRLKESGGSVV
ncbi:nucleophile aminohydrolase [Schizothecium vesticola]|uniref:Nucleophile aminohydrolase n=1 Tax=Schizothecium vesticola TaxID=314040 RepID=A0AA40EKM2_9PEZI|nr:nucleophile aminohydrolase [Schizothecium vesticola]